MYRLPLFLISPRKNYIWGGLKLTKNCIVFLGLLAFFFKRIAFSSLCNIICILIFAVFYPQCACEHHNNRTKNQSLLQEILPLPSFHKAGLLNMRLFPCVDYKTVSTFANACYKWTTRPSTWLVETNKKNYPNQSENYEIFRLSVQQR